MDKLQAFFCPNCGGYDPRRYFVSKDDIHRSCLGRQIMTIKCSICSYLVATTYFLPEISNTEDLISALALISLSNSQLIFAKSSGGFLIHVYSTRHHSKSD